MTAHHELGARLARLASERAGQDKLRTLGRLMLADHTAELEIMRGWWRRWFGGELPPPTLEEHQTMPGMPAPGDVDALETLAGAAFDGRFIPLMIFHHQGALTMADDALERAADPRLRLLASSIRHAQRGQIDWMRAIAADGAVGSGGSRRASRAA